MKKIKINKDKQKQLQDILSHHKNYKAFSANQKSAYAYSNSIGIKVCPYCNINYIYTVFSLGGKKKTSVLRPSLDHFENKARNKSLELKWHNLIPSCDPCNSRLKLQKVFKRSSHIHPFFDDFDSIITIGISLMGCNYLDEENLDIVFRKHENCGNSDDYRKAKRNIDDFKLKERYQHHKDEVVSIFSKIKFYNKAKITEIDKLLNGDNSLRYNMFQDEYCDINKTSLGKLKRDIINKYK